MTDQDRISPYNIHTISSRQVMRITKKYQLLVDLIPNSSNKNQKSCLPDSKENY